MSQKWKIAKSAPAKSLAKLKAYPVWLADLLYRRGVRTVKEAEEYLNPHYERDLLPPAEMLGMSKAVKRIWQAIDTDEKIMIFADFDADGVPAGVLLHLFFKEVGFSNYDIYIPDRNVEKHGLSKPAVEKFMAEKVNLIVTVDCGITNAEEVAFAKKNKIDCIITDHHLPGEKLPKAVAIVDSKQIEDTYSFKVLCGCGVAFKLVLGLMDAAGERHIFPIGWDKWLLDLVAISTVADMVPMVGENRILTHFGLKVLRKTKRLGLLELFKVLKLQLVYISEDDIGFMIAPRLNAASRMDHANQTFFLLTTENKEEAQKISKFLDDKNKERRDKVDIVLQETEKYLATLTEIPPIICYGRPDWQVGGLGLAANRLKDKYGRPVFLWASAGPGEFKGSGRSDGSINLVELMKLANADGVFTEFGGHAMAAGFSVEESKEPLVAENILNAYNNAPKDQLAPALEADREISLDDINWDTYYMMEKLGPFGMENSKPVFLLKGATLAENKTFGNGGIHLELKFKKPYGELISAIGFFNCPPTEKDCPFDVVAGHIWNGVSLQVGEKLDILGNLEKSTFKGRPELRLRIVDIRKAE